MARTLLIFDTANDFRPLLETSFKTIFDKYERAYGPTAVRRHPFYAEYSHGPPCKRTA